MQVPPDILNIRRIVAQGGNDQAVERAGVLLLAEIGGKAEIAVQVRERTRGLVHPWRGAAGVDRGGRHLQVGESHGAIECMGLGPCGQGAGEAQRHH